MNPSVHARHLTVNEQTPPQDGNKRKPGMISPGAVKSRLVAACCLVAMTLVQGCGGSKPKKFESAEGKYSVISPRELKIQVLPVPTPKGEVKMTMQLGEDPQGAHSAGFVDFPHDENLTPQDRLKGGRDGALATYGGRLIHEKPLSLNGNPGLEISFSAKIENKLVYMKQRTYCVGNRMYVMLAMGFEAHRPADDQFLDSFKLIE